MDKESHKEPIEKCLLLTDKGVDNGFKETTASCNLPKIMAMMAQKMESILDSSIQKKRRDQVFFLSPVKA